MENVPKETETIAVKRTERLNSKLLESHSRLNFVPAWWTNGVFEMLGVLVVVGLNIYMILPFFSYHISDVPFSGPVIPLLIKGFGLLSLSYATATTALLIISFVLFPVSVYVLVRWITGRKLAAFLSILAMSLPFYPFARSRILSAFASNDWPHILSISLIPIAIYGVLSFIREGQTKNLVIASFFSAIVALTSPFAFLTFVFFAAICAFSEMLLGQGRLKAVRLATVMIFTAGLCSFWYHPSFFYWMVMGDMGLDIRATVRRLVPISLFAAPVLGVFGFLLFDRKPLLQPVFLATFSTIVFTMIVVAGGGFVPSHPTRYAPELGLSLALLIGIGTMKLIEYVRFSQVSVKNLDLTILSNGVVLVLTALISVSVVLARDSIVGSTEQVLGLWTEVNKGEMWLARDNYSGLSNYLGYVITIVTIAIMIFLFRKKEPSHVSKTP